MTVFWYRFMDQSEKHFSETSEWAVGFSETSVNFYQTKLSINQKTIFFTGITYENFKPRNVLLR